MFWKRREEPSPLPKVAVCYADSAVTRRAADWLAQLNLCKPIAILADTPKDALWLCQREEPSLLVLEAMPDAMERLDDPSRDITGCCELSAQVKEQLPTCRVCLVCDARFHDYEPTLEKAVETGLIDGYRIGRLARLHIETWLAAPPTQTAISGKPPQSLSKNG